MVGVGHCVLRLVSVGGLWGGLVGVDKTSSRVCIRSGSVSCAGACVWCNAAACGVRTVCVVRGVSGVAVVFGYCIAVCGGVACAALNVVGSKKCSTPARGHEHTADALFRRAAA